MHRAPPARRDGTRPVHFVAPVRRHPRRL